MSDSIQVLVPAGFGLCQSGVKGDPITPPQTPAAAFGSATLHAAITPLENVKYGAVPQAMRALPQWVCWRHVQQGPRKAKVPFNPVTGGMASPTNPRDWNDFQTVATSSRYYDGIGFVLTKSDPLFGIDLDDKLDNPATQDELNLFQAIFNQFGTYTEVSPSGRGLRIIGIGALPANIKGIRVGHVELYDAEHYLTITGNTDFSGLAWVPQGLETVATVCNCQPDLDNLLRYLQALGARNSTIDSPLVEILETKTCYQIMETCWNQSNSEKFQALWYGNWRTLQIGDGSQSAADMSFMEFLRNAGATLEQTLEIFRHSKLYRPPPAKAATYPLRTAKATFRIGQSEREAWVALKEGFNIGL